MILNVSRITQPAAEPIDPLIEAFNLTLVPAGPKGLKGDLGNAGWAPVLGAELDGARAVFVIVDWVGGEGTKPTEIGYIGPEGIVATAAEALDVRGTVGPQGVSITGATVNGSYQLILTLSNGATLIAGNVRGPTGAQGPSGTLAIGTVTTGAPGSPVVITNVGTASAAILDISIPAGNEGPQGDAATITIGSVITVAAGTPASVTNSGTSGAAVFDFFIPQGADGADGSGDLTGPASSVAGNLARFSDTTGKLIEDGGTPAENVAAAINGATAKGTPVDADVLGLIDSAAGNVLKKLTWANLKATLKTYFDTLYQAGGSYAAAVHSHTVSQLSDASANGRSLLQSANYASMFGLLKQAATSTATGVVELATDTEAQTGTDTSRAITPANLSARTATTTRTGLVELATDVEAAAGTDTSRVMTVKQVADYVAANGGGNVIVQRGDVYSGAVSIGTIPDYVYVDVTISAVSDVTKCFVLVEGSFTTVAGAAGMFFSTTSRETWIAMGRLTSPTNLRIFSPVQSGTPASAVRAAWQIVEFA